MRDLPPRAGHTFPGCEMPMMDREPDGSTRPHTPGTPTFTRPRNRSFLGSEPELPRRGQLSSTSSLDSPLSPSHPKSSWGRFDPYDSAEVMSVLCMMHNVDSAYLIACARPDLENTEITFRVKIRSMLALQRCLTKCTENLWKKGSPLLLWWQVRTSDAVCHRQHKIKIEFDV